MKVYKFYNNGAEQHDKFRDLHLRGISFEWNIKKLLYISKQSGGAYLVGVSLLSEDE